MTNYLIPFKTQLLIIELITNCLDIEWGVKKMVVYQKNNFKHSSLPDEEFMNSEQIDYFRSKLIAWKESILKESKEIKSTLIVKGQSILIFTLPKLKRPINWQSNFNCQSKNHQDEFNYVFSNSVPAATIIKKYPINNNDIIYRRKINNLYEHCGELLSKEEHSISIPDSLFPYIKNTFIIKCL